MTRKLLESLKRARQEDTYVMTFYDIEKAYPRICRDALWRLLKKQGVDQRFIAVCKALHEHTKVYVRAEGGLSDPYVMERGLREGCPSSPPLFNVYHHAVMRDFRARRAACAATKGVATGVLWTHCVNGNLSFE